MREISVASGLLVLARLRAARIFLDRRQGHAERCRFCDYTTQLSPERRVGSWTHVIAKTEGFRNDVSVFVVNDDDLIRTAIQGMLKSVGLRSETFGTPQDFLKSRRVQGPSCLVLDVRLPGISGLDLQRELTEAGIKIPIIFITGHGDIPMSVKAMKSAVEFLTKPFRNQELLDAIHQALQHDP